MTDLRPPAEPDPWTCEPTFVTIARGVLAVTPPWHTYRIGVQAETPEAARVLFSLALNRWKALDELVRRDRQRRLVPAET